MLEPETNGVAALRGQSGAEAGSVSTRGVRCASVLVIRLFFAVIFLLATVQLCIAGQWGVAGLAFLIMALLVPKARVSQ